ncbi:MAG: hypothetical protein ACOCUI_02075, partial [bacterium]
MANENISPQEYFDNFVNSVNYAMSRINKMQTYTPSLANDYMQSINISPNKPTSTQIKNWLENPEKYSDQLAEVSQYLESVIMFYQRTIYHFATLLCFNYYLYPITPPPDKNDSKNINIYNNSYKKALDWLRKFRPKEQFQNVMFGVMREGGKFYYVRKSREFIDLQEMPSDYCKIDGRSSVGYTYSFNMNFFDKASVELYAPRFKEWYDDFLKEKNRGISYYKKMPTEESTVFLFDDTRAVRLNPLRSLFKDAIDIQDYKNLLKTKAELDTWKLIYMKAPTDKDGKPTLDYNLIAAWVAQAQAALPYGAVAFGSAMEAEEIKVGDSQNMNILGNIVSKRYWEDAGINANLMGNSDAKTASAITASAKTDVNFVSHMYQQFQRFINWQLYLNTGKYKFGVNFFGDKFTIKETQKQLGETIQ